MSHDERKPPEQRRPSAAGALLEDLESIRDLLDAESRAAMDDDIPVLREVVRREPPAALDAPSYREEVQTDLFDARNFADRLLDDSWQEQSDAILASARRTADALAAKLAPQVSASARERLRSRIAEELPPLIEQVVGEALDELQDRLLGLLRHEMARLAEATLIEAAEQPQPRNPSPQDD